MGGSVSLNTSLHSGDKVNQELRAVEVSLTGLPVGLYVPWGAVDSMRLAWMGDCTSCCNGRLQWSFLWTRKEFRRRLA